MWVLGLGVEVAGAAVAGDVVVGLPRATGIQAEMAKGALLCRLAETLEGAHLGDTHRRPKVKAEATHNINKALAVFRRAGRVAPRHLWSAADLAAGDAKSAWGVLFDIRAAYDAGFEKGSSKKNAFEKTPVRGRVRGRVLRVTPAGRGIRRPQGRDRRRGGPGRLPRTPALFRERNIFSDVSGADFRAESRRIRGGRLPAPRRARRAAHRAARASPLRAAAGSRRARARGAADGRRRSRREDGEDPPRRRGGRGGGGDARGFRGCCGGG